MTTVALQVEVPIACFRQSRARQNIETYPVPPPSTVYGMLLSLVGEIDRYKHCGVRLAIALLSNPEKSIVLRKFHRHKKKDILDPSNICPDYQELLTDIQLAVWVDTGSEKAKPDLPERILMSFGDPCSVTRFGGLSLGESPYLVNAVTLLTNPANDMGLWLVQAERGDLTLPYWVDHVGASRTCWRRYTLRSSPLHQPDELAWTEIDSC